MQCEEEAAITPTGEGSMQFEVNLTEEMTRLATDALLDVTCSYHSVANDECAASKVTEADCEALAEATATIALDSSKRILPEDLDGIGAFVVRVAQQWLVWWISLCCCGLDCCGGSRRKRQRRLQEAEQTVERTIDKLVASRRQLIVRRGQQQTAQRMDEQARRLRKKTGTSDGTSSAGDEALHVDPVPQDLLGRMLRPIATAAFSTDALASFERQSMLREMLLLAPPKLGGVLAWAVHELVHAKPEVMRLLVAQVDKAATDVTNRTGSIGGNGDYESDGTASSDSDGDGLGSDDEGHQSVEEERQERLYDYSHASSDEDGDDDDDKDDDDEGGGQQKQRTISNRALSKLKYLRAVVMETLRLHSTPIIARTCVREMELDVGGDGDEYDSDEEDAHAGPSSFVVPAGTVLFVVPSLIRSLEGCSSESRRAAQQQEQEHLQCFDPDRWCKGKDGRSHEPTFSVPFGLGERHCVASHFATAALSKALFMLLQR
jgi:hypothetical protein